MTDVVNLVTTTPSRFTVIRPELLPAMRVLQSISTEDMISNRMARFKALWAAYDPPFAAQYDVENLPFDPIRINQECNSFFEALVRDRVNQACRAITLAFAVGSDLDAIASRYPYGVPRLDYDGDGVPDEDDSSYRTRIWLSPSILSLNGPGQGTYESYIFWALSAPQPSGETRLKHASAFTKRATGHVFIPIMRDDYRPVTRQEFLSEDWLTTDEGSPNPSDAQIKAVYDYINQRGFARKGLTDWVSVLRPKITRTNIIAKIKLFPGVDSATLMQEVNAQVLELVNAIRWLGADLTHLSLKGAMAAAGVYNVDLLEPLADVVVPQDGVIKVDEIRLSYVGVGE
jgi:phage-related baseplate assembly protein